MLYKDKSWAEIALDEIIRAVIKNKDINDTPTEIINDSIRIINICLKGKFIGTELGEQLSKNLIINSS